MTTITISSSRTAAPLATLIFFFFTATATTELYTLSLHDALPITYSGPSFPTSSVRILLVSTSVSSLRRDRKSTRLNSSHVKSSYAVFCLNTQKTKPRCLKIRLHDILHISTSIDYAQH